MQTVLVAGGAGFIGSHLCESLLEDDYKVICVDNFITGEKSNVSHLTDNENFELVEKDIINISVDDLPRTDYILHLASPASPNLSSPKSYIAFPIETLLVNSKGTYNLLEIARNNKSVFLYASTSEIYGDPKVSPQGEDYFGNVNPNGVRSVYDEGKRFGEAITAAYNRKFDLDTRIVRIFNTYGPKMRPDDGRVVSDFVTQAITDSPLTIFGDGNQTRSFCYIDDMLKGIKKAAFGELAKGEVINLGNTQEISIMELAGIVRRLTDSKSTIIKKDLPSDDPQIRNPDISKAKKLLDWEPKVPLEEGLLKTIKYFKSI